MTKLKQLKIANTILLILLPLILFSSIQMEISSGDSFAGISFQWIVIIHVVINIIAILCTLWHLYLHFEWKNWISKIKKLKSVNAKTIIIVTCVVFISGMISLFHLLPSWQHGTIGGIHGKFGFLFILLGIYHIIQRWKWIKKNL